MSCVTNTQATLSLTGLCDGQLSASWQHVISRASCLCPQFSPQAFLQGFRILLNMVYQMPMGCCKNPLQKKAGHLEPAEESLHCSVGIDAMGGVLYPEDMAAAQSCFLLLWAKASFWTHPPPISLLVSPIHLLGPFSGNHLPLNLVCL